MKISISGLMLDPLLNCQSMPLLLLCRHAISSLSLILVSTGLRRQDGSNAILDDGSKRCCKGIVSAFALTRKSSGRSRRSLSTWPPLFIWADEHDTLKIQGTEADARQRWMTDAMRHCTTPPDIATRDLAPVGLDGERIRTEMGFPMTMWSLV